MLDELKKFADQMNISVIEYVEGDIRLFYKQKLKFKNTTIQNSILASEVLKNWNNQKQSLKMNYYKDTFQFYDLLENALREHRRNEKLEMILSPNK